MPPLFQSYNTISLAVHAQLDSVLRLWQRRLGPDLLAVYLHGSLSLGRFQEENGDLDLLVLTARKLPREERLSLARDLLDLDQRPCPLELSALYIEDLRPWRHPAPCQFHYSGAWTDHYEKLLSGACTDSFLLDTDFPDPDIACHVRLTKERGVTLYGPYPQTFLPEIPESNFWQSISMDLYSCGILTLARVLSYQRLGRIVSKYDAALWAMDIVPERLRYLLEDAVGEKYCKKACPKPPPEDLAALRRFLTGQIEEDRGDRIPRI